MEEASHLASPRLVSNGVGVFDGHALGPNAYARLDLLARHGLPGPTEPGGTLLSFDISQIAALGERWMPFDPRRNRKVDLQTERAVQRSATGLCAFIRTLADGLAPWLRTPAGVEARRHLLAEIGGRMRGLCSFPDNH